MGGGGREGEGGEVEGYEEFSIDGVVLWIEKEEEKGEEG